jgi:hypothetical protein
MAFKDTRTPVATVFENLEAGLTVEEVMEEFSVTREQIPLVRSCGAAFRGREQLENEFAALGSRGILTGGASSQQETQGKHFFTASWRDFMPRRRAPPWSINKRHPMNLTTDNILFTAYSDD